MAEHSLNLVVDEERCGSSARPLRWHEDRLQQQDQNQQQHSSSSINTFLVEMTNCDEDYFNTQEVGDSHVRYERVDVCHPAK